MNRQKVIINVGVSGSGKTTWSIDQINKDSNIVRINRDDLRRHFYGSLDGYYEHKAFNSREEFISSIEDLMFINALQQGYSVIIDNTNLKPKYIQKWIDYVKAYNNRYTSNGFEYLEIDVHFKLFKEADSQVLKSRVHSRDSLESERLDCKLNYIDKQISSLESAISYVEDNYKNRII